MRPVDRSSRFSRTTTCAALLACLAGGAGCSSAPSDEPVGGDEAALTEQCRLETIAPISWTASGVLSVAIDGAGNPHVVAVASWFGTPRPTYATRTNGVWHTEVIADAMRVLSASVDVVGDAVRVTATKTDGESTVYERGPDGFVAVGAAPASGAVVASRWKFHLASIVSGSDHHVVDLAERGADLELRTLQIGSTSWETHALGGHPELLPYEQAIVRRTDDGTFQVAVQGEDGALGIWRADAPAGLTLLGVGSTGRAGFDFLPSPTSTAPPELLYHRRDADLAQPSGWLYRDGTGNTEIVSNGPGQYGTPKLRRGDDGVLRAIVWTPAPGAAGQLGDGVATYVRRDPTGWTTAGQWSAKSATLATRAGRTVVALLFSRPSPLDNELALVDCSAAP